VKSRWSESDAIDRLDDTGRGRVIGWEAEVEVEAEAEVAAIESSSINQTQDSNPTHPAIYYRSSSSTQHCIKPSSDIVLLHQRGVW